MVLNEIIKITATITTTTTTTAPNTTRRRLVTKEQTHFYDAATAGRYFYVAIALVAALAIFAAEEDT